MSKCKAVVDFSGYTGEDLPPVATTIGGKMTGNANFPQPPVNSAE